MNVSPDAREPKLMCQVTLCAQFVPVSWCIKISGPRQCILCGFTEPGQQGTCRSAPFPAFSEA